jgi:DNA-damage-inducible protein J
MTTLNIRIEETTKIAAAKALADIGLDISSGVKLFLNQVVTEQGLPFVPTKNPAVIRARWDAQVAKAIKTKGHKTAKNALKGL